MRDTRDEGANNLGKDRIDVFDAMGFVDDNVFEAAVLIKDISCEVIHFKIS
jgi:hypothetical protein